MLDGIDLVRHVQELTRELAKLNRLGDLYKKAVAGLLHPLGFDRAALFLYDTITHEMIGTWGTNDHGDLSDESAYRSFIGLDKSYLDEALAEPDYLKVWEDRVLTLWDRPVGRGWNAMVVLQDGERTIGWLSVDNAFHHRPLSAMERQVLSLYGRTLSTLIQRRQYEEVTEKYRRQNELKDRLFTILAHDLRGPIGNLSVMLGMACDQPMDSADLHEILSESRQAALRTYNLVENVLGWVRSQIEEVAALRERIPLLRPLVAVQIWLEATAKAKGIHLIVDCHDSLTLVGDERMVETVVRNLVSNAIKYSPPNSSVILRGRMDHERLQVEVVDHGVGMEPDRVATLFASRQNKSQPGTSGEGGNGLGLMFSADLARTLGGHLEADSEPGKGSTFRMVLPDELDGEL